LLFWLSLTPFVTSWMGQTNFGAWPAAAYGLDLLAAACAYYVLTHLLISHHGKESPLAVAVGRDLKGLTSVAIYLAAIPLAFVHPWISCALYVLVTVMWLIPDRRIETTLVEKEPVRRTE
jgi:uncharacterized membrane protein